MDHNESVLTCTFEAGAIYATLVSMTGYDGRTRGGQPLEQRKFQRFVQTTLETNKRIQGSESYLCTFHHLYISEIYLQSLYHIMNLNFPI